MTEAQKLLAEALEANSNMVRLKGHLMLHCRLPYICGHSKL